MRNSAAVMAGALTRPLTEVLDVLSFHSAAIRVKWRKLLQAEEPCGKHVARLSGLQIIPLAWDPSALGREAHRAESVSQGQDLAHNGVPAECAAAAVALYVESCLPYLMSGDSLNAKRMKALVRWAASYQFLILSGYCHEASAAVASHEEKLSQAERRAQEFSARLAEAYEKERRRLAQDLHDEIGHDLIVLKLYTEVIALDLKKGDTVQLSRKLKESISLIKHALKSVRSLTFDLGPAIWHEQGFIPAVRLYARQFSGRTGIRVHVDTTRLRANLPQSCETALYKVLQGALSNVVAHADAKFVRIKLSTLQDSATMTIVDDGKGFNAERKMQKPVTSYGLRAMRDRIELLGGTIRFTPASARPGVARPGTRIELQVPLHGSETT